MPSFGGFRVRTTNIGSSKSQRYITMLIVALVLAWCGIVHVRVEPERVLNDLEKTTLQDYSS